MEKQDLYEMCKSIIDLNKQRYVIIKNEIEDIIRNNISDNMECIHFKSWEMEK